MFDLKKYSRQNIKNDILSGLVVAVALVPEAIAFSFIAGVSPIVGLYTAFILGIITLLIGGKPGMISGATGTGNITCGFFGGMAGCAMIGQSIINYTSGGIGRLSSFVAA